MEESRLVMVEDFHWKSLRAAKLPLGKEAGIVARESGGGTGWSWKSGRENEGITWMSTKPSQPRARHSRLDLARQSRSHKIHMLFLYCMGPAGCVTTAAGTELLAP